MNKTTLFTCLLSMFYMIASANNNNEPHVEEGKEKDAIDSGRRYHLETFIKWFEARGGRISPNITVDHFPGMGNGVKALADIDENEPLVFIPRDIIISSELIKESKDEYHQMLVQAFNTDESLLIAFILLEEARGEASLWSPYFKVLPSFIPNLLSYSSDELAELQIAEYIVELRTEQRHKLSSYLYFTNSSSRFWPSDLQKVTFEKYAWASSILDSRGFRFQGQIKLAPFADMFNYWPHAEPRNRDGGKFFLKHHVVKSNGLHISSDRFTLRNTQIFEDYGDNNDDIYFQYHGFVPDANPFRTVQLTMPSATLHIANGQSNENIVILNEVTTSFLHELRFSSPPRKLIDSSGVLGQSMEIYLTALAFTEDEILECRDVISNSNRSWKLILELCGFQKVTDYFRRFHGRMISENERNTTDGLVLRVLEILKKLIDTTIAEFPTKIEVDQNLLNAAEKALNEDDLVESEYHRLLKTLNILRYRLSMKKHWLRLRDLYFPISAKKEIKEIQQRNSNDLQMKVAYFNDWFKKGIEGKTKTKIEAAYIPNFRIGTITIENVSREESYLNVPLDMIMDINKASQDPIFNDFLNQLFQKYKRRDAFHELIFFLMYERFVKAEKSYFWPYLQLLPEVNQLDLPLQWTEDQIIARLGPSDLRFNVMEYKDKVASYFKIVSSAEIVSIFFSSNSVNGVFSLERYIWATSILDSRSIWWEGTRHLVPMLDFVNCHVNPSGIRVHSTKLETVSAHSGSDQLKMAVTRAAIPFSKGQQLFEDYGQPNHIYYLYHGFILDNNPHDCVHIHLSMTQEEWDNVDKVTAKPILSQFGYRGNGKIIPSTSFCLAPKTEFNKDIAPSVWLYLNIINGDYKELKDLSTVEMLDRLSKPSTKVAAELMDMLKERALAYEKHSDSDHPLSNAFVKAEKTIYNTFFKAHKHHDLKSEL